MSGHGGGAGRTPGHHFLAQGASDRSARKADRDGFAGNMDDDGGPGADAVRRDALAAASRAAAAVRDIFWCLLRLGLFGFRPRAGQ